MAAITTSGGGRSWQRIVDPGTGYTSKTSGWTADSFSGGFEIDFTNYVPNGTVEAWITILQGGTQSKVYVRASGDTNISNTPDASTEISARIMQDDDQIYHGPVQLSSDYKIQIAVTNTGTDIYVSYPARVKL
jgi:hypothetical protein